MIGYSINLVWISFVLMTSCNVSNLFQERSDSLNRNLGESIPKDTCQYIEYRQKCKSEIKQFNDSINIYLKTNLLKYSKPINSEIGINRELLDLYYNYCINIIKSDEQYCFDSYMDTLLSFEQEYSIDEYPIIFNCKLGYPVEIEFKEVDFNNDNLEDYLSKLRIRSFGNSSYDLLLGFVSENTTFQIKEIVSSVGFTYIIENDKVFIEDFEYAKEDPLCCPSIKVNYEIFFYDSFSLQELSRSVVQK